MSNAKAQDLFRAKIENRDQIRTRPERSQCHSHDANQRLVQPNSPSYQCLTTHAGTLATLRPFPTLASLISASSASASSYSIISRLVGW